MLAANSISKPSVFSNFPDDLIRRITEQLPPAGPEIAALAADSVLSQNSFVRAGKYRFQAEQHYSGTHSHAKIMSTTRSIYTQFSSITSPWDQSRLLRSLSQNPHLKSPRWMRVFLSRAYGLIERIDKHQTDIGVRLTIYNAIENIPPEHRLQLIRIATPTAQQLQGVLKNNPKTLYALTALYLRAAVQTIREKTIQREQLIHLLNGLIEVTPKRYIDYLITDKKLPLQMHYDDSFDDNLSPFIIHALDFIPIADEVNATEITHDVLARFGSTERANYRQCEYFNANKFTHNQQQTFFPQLVDAVGKAAERHAMREAFEQMLRKTSELDPTLHQLAINKLRLF